MLGAKILLIAFDMLEATLVHFVVAFVWVQLCIHWFCYNGATKEHCCIKWCEKFRRVWMQEWVDQKIGHDNIFINPFPLYFFKP